MCPTRCAPHNVPPTMCTSILHPPARPPHTHTPPPPTQPSRARQDCLGGCFSPQYALHGEVAQLRVWSRVLTQ